MRKRTIGMLVVAVLLAGLAARLVETRLNAPAPAPVKVAPAPSVLVAAANLTPGQFLRASDLRWQTWPPGSLAPGYVVSGHAHRQAIAGRVLRVPIAAGQPVTDAATVAPGDHGFLAAVLKPGMRAISVAITATSGLHGLVSPGDRVDLILTEALPAQQNSMLRHAGLTILRDVRVLAINRDLNPAAWKSGLKGSLLGKASKQQHVNGQQTATLEVTPKEVRVVAVAEAMGHLSLSLRSLGRTASGLAKVAALDRATRPAPGSMSAPSDPVSTPVATRTSYTLDSNVSPLLPPFPSPGVAPQGQPSVGGAPVVTVLRGSVAGSSRSGAAAGTPTGGAQMNGVAK